MDDFRLFGAVCHDFLDVCGRSIALLGHGYGRFALVCLDDGVCDHRRDELDGADGVVVAGDDIVDEVGVAVGVGLAVCPSPS